MEYTTGMKESHKQTLDSVNKKITDLISRYENLKVQNAGLKEEINRLNSKVLYYETELNRSNNTIKELEDRINILNLRKAFSASAEDAGQAKASINRLIKEIDKCIDLINE